MTAATFTLTGTQAADVAISNDGSTIYASFDDGYIREYQVSTGALINQWHVGMNLGAIDLSPDGSYLAIVEDQPLSGSIASYWPDSSFAVTTYKLDLATGTTTSYVYNTAGDEYSFSDIAVLSNGKWLLTEQIFPGWSGWASPKLLNPATGQYSALDLTIVNNSVLSPSADGSRVLFGEPTSSDAPMDIYSATTGQLIRHANYQDNVMGINYGVQAYSGEAGIGIQVLAYGLNVYDNSLHLQRNISSVGTSFNSITGAAFDPTGAHLFLFDNAAHAIVELATSDWSIVQTIPVAATVTISPRGYGNKLMVDPGGHYFTVDSDSGLQLIAMPDAPAFTGTSGDDILSGTVFADRLAGGPGNDIYVVNGPGDVVTENPGEGTDEVRTMLAAYTLAANVEKLTGLSSSGQTLAGNDGNDVITGGSGDDTLTGGAGQDVLDGGDGNDILFSHVATPGAAMFALVPSLDTLAEHDVLRGGAGNDIIFAGYGDDVDGGPNDAYGDKLAISFMGATSGVTADFRLLGSQPSITIGGGTITGIEEVFSIEGSNYDDLLAGWASSFYPTGGAIYGRGGNDHIIAGYYAGWGGSAIYGGDGDDLIDLTGAGYGPSAYGDAGDDTIIGGNSYERIDGGTGNDKLYGNYGFDTLIGGDGDDLLDGGNFDDNLDGGIGNDILYGAGDLDTIKGGAGDDIIYGDQSPLGSANGLSPSRNDDVLSGDDGNDTIYGDWGNDQIDGGAGDDTLDGGTGQDSMKGGTGNDIFYVDNAGDTVTENAGEGTDEVRTSLATYTLGANVENLTGLSASGQALTGNGLANHITAGGGDDVLVGRGGSDTLDGGAGFDTASYTGNGAGIQVTVDVPNHGTVVENGTDSDSFSGIEKVIGTGYADSFANNSFTGMTFAGGDGDDVYTVLGSSDTIVETLNGGTDEIRAGGPTYTLGANVEKLTGLSAGGQALTGNGDANVITGNSGNDIIDGGAGADLMAGGGGNDVYYVDNAGDVVSEPATNGGTDEVRTALSVYTLGANVENLTGLSASGQTLIGNGDANTITGGGGNDVFDGGVGADLLIGGGGNDVYYVDVGDTVSEGAGAGTDEARTSLASYMLAANVENLTGLSSSGQSLTGNAGDNVIIANSGNDIVEGGDGNDAMDGGAGIDTLSFAGAGGAITFSLASGAAQATGGAGTDSAINFENLTGSAFTDTLTGDGGANVIDGGAGADHMAGGLGNDVYLVDNAGDVVTENAGEGTDEIRTTLSTYTIADNVEKLTGAGSGFQTLRGNAGNNIIATGAGGGFVDFSAGGTDTGTGNTGVDVFYFGAALDQTDQANGGAGKDIAVLQGDYSGGVTLGDHALDNIETLSILSHTDTRFGGDGASPFSYDITTVEGNVAAGQQLVVNASTLEAGENFTFDGSAEHDGGFFIYGGKGDDHLTGGSGLDVFFFAEDGRFGANDSVNGGAGSDILVLRGNYTIDMGTSAVTNIETVTLMSGSDSRFFATTSNFSYDIKTAESTVAPGATMTFNGGGLHAGETLHFDGSAETDGGAFRVFGGADADIITGGGGNDLILGGLGADTLTGGAGNDTFRYQDVAESTSTAHDQILDFASGDKIDLSRIDAISGGGNDAFTFVAAFDGHAGELTATNGGSGNVWTVSGDVDGDGLADFQLLVTVADSHTIGANDFLL